VGDEIVLRLDKETARDLWSVLCMYGEHYAAGASIEPLPPEVEHRLGKFLRSLDVALGNPGRIA
jgi:hypothetical protein